MALRPASSGLALAKVNATVDTRGAAKFLNGIARDIPRQAERAMRNTSAWWAGKSRRHAPVRASVNRKQKRSGASGPLYSRGGRGMLKKSMAAFTRWHGDELRGGVLAGTHYALWLLAGTRHIAQGRVMQWRPGDKPIDKWPAKAGYQNTRDWIAAGRPSGTKARGGNPRAKLPIIVPWRAEARDRFVDDLRRKIDYGS